MLVNACDVSNYFHRQVASHYLMIRLRIGLFLVSFGHLNAATASSKLSGAYS